MCVPIEIDASKHCFYKHVILGRLCYKWKIK